MADSYPPPDTAPPALWAPWRMKYLETTRAPDGEGCFLCSAAGDPSRDRQTFVFLRRRLTFALLNLYPYTNGHLMVAPLAHKGSLAELSDAEMLELFQTVRDAQAMLTAVMKPDGFNVGINLGRAAGAGLPGHLHIHVVPRWSGDANFMTAAAGVRIIPQELADTHARLVEAAAVLGLS